MSSNIASAAIGGAGSVLSGSSGKKGASNAAKIQAAAYDRATQAQQQQFQQTRTDLAPYMGAGTAALGGQQTLLGLNGNDAQASAIEALKASPAFTSLFNTGNDAILQNAAATGGLRGGNAQSSLANFGSSLLATVIQNQLGNLGGLSSLGESAAAGAANAGQNSANAISNLAVQQGNSAAGNVLGQTAIGNNTINGLQASLQKLLAGKSALGSVSAGSTQQLMPAAQNLIANNSALF
jgi:hypothetical protein